MGESRQPLREDRTGRSWPVEEPCRVEASGFAQVAKSAIDIVRSPAPGTVTRIPGADTRRGRVPQA